MKISRGQLRQIIREELEERIGGTGRRHLRTLREAEGITLANALAANDQTEAQLGDAITALAPTGKVRTDRVGIIDTMFGQNSGFTTLPLARIDPANREGVGRDKSQTHKTLTTVDGEKLIVMIEPDPTLEDKYPDGKGWPADAYVLKLGGVLPQVDRGGSHRYFFVLKK